MTGSVTGDLQGLDAERYIVKARGVLICISEMVVVGLMCIEELAATKGVTGIQTLFSEPTLSSSSRRKLYCETTSMSVLCLYSTVLITVTL